MTAAVCISSLYSGAVSVRLTGDFDLVSAPALAERLDCALGASPDVVVDLHDLTFLDAAVIATLLRAQRRALLQGGSLVLIEASPWVEKVLAASRATEAIPLLPHQRSVRDGVGSLGGAAQGFRQPVGRG